MSLAKIHVYYIISLSINTDSQGKKRKKKKTKRKKENAGHFANFKIMSFVHIFSFQVLIAKFIPSHCYRLRPHNSSELINL